SGKDRFPDVNVRSLGLHAARATGDSMPSAYPLQVLVPPHGWGARPGAGWRLRMSPRDPTPLRAVRTRPAPPHGPGPAAFQRGDHVELAHRLPPDLGGQTVFDRDRLWRYDPDRRLSTGGAVGTPPPLL